MKKLMMILMIAIGVSSVAFGARRCRYLGATKTHLQQVLTATALNFVGIANWLDGVPLAKTRQSAFVKLMAQPASF